MTKIFLICGKICCGKSTYAEHLRMENNAVLLSVDEIMLAVFGLYAGDNHDEYTERIQKYLFEKSVKIIESGVNMVLDWGFWTRSSRAYARDFYESRNIGYEFHYIDVTDEIWQVRIDKRNRAVSAGETVAYLIDDKLAVKFANLFEPPTEDEIDVWITDKMISKDNLAIRRMRKDKADMELLLEWLSNPTVLEYAYGEDAP